MHEWLCDVRCDAIGNLDLGGGALEEEMVTIPVVCSGTTTMMIKVRV
jgi:hypothetical protein